MCEGERKREEQTTDKPRRGHRAVAAAALIARHAFREQHGGCIASVKINIWKLLLVRLIGKFGIVWLKTVEMNDERLG